MLDPAAVRARLADVRERIARAAARAGRDPSEIRLIAVSNEPVVRGSVQRVTVEQAVREWTYDALYTLLTHEARERFGLIKGYRLILEIEGVSNLDGLKNVAVKFAEQIRKAHGEETAARFRRQLGATE